MVFHIHRELNGVDGGNIIDGYWGTPTSTLDWCEENYQISHYVAEFYNTFSNLNYMALGILGIYQAFKIGSEIKDYFPYIFGVLLIGIGSFAFHGTLLYESQLADELPMLYGTATLLFNLFTIKSSKYSFILALALFSYCATIHYYYETSRIPEVFQLGYALLALTSATYPIGLLRAFSKEYPERKTALWNLYFWSLSSYALGFTCWIYENNNCDHVRDWRSQQNPFIQPVSQLHAWWHLLTGLGGYGNVVLIHFMRLIFLKRKNVEVRYIFGIYPFLDFIRKLKLS